MRTPVCCCCCRCSITCSWIKTALLPALKQAGSAALFVGILAQSGGFFVHMIVGQPNGPSIGTFITNAGVALLATATVILIYGLVTTH